MPLVPVPQNTVGIAQGTSARIQAPDLRGGALDGLGRGAQQLAGAVSDYAQNARRTEIQQAHTLATDADIAFASYSSALQNDPDKGIFALRGRDAVNALPGTLDNLKERRREIEKTLKSPDARQAFGRMADQRMASYEAGLSRFASDQQRHWQAETSVVTINANAADAVTNYRNPEAQDLAIERVVHEYANLADREGLPEEVGLVNARAKVSEMRLGSVQRYAEQNPAEAQAYYEQHKGQIVGGDQATAERAIRISTDRAEAEQRRQEAEARAQQAHDLALKRESLATVKVQLDSGAGTHADWTALADAYAGIGDTSSAASARQKATELKAVEAYRGAPLGQMDARLSELNGKAGLSPADAAERTGLTALRQQTASRLDQPGGALAQLEYASGRPVAQLEPRNPSSYRARAAQAVTAALTYGRRVVEPLTQAETQPLKDLVSGDSAQRLSALQTIAKFGDPRAIDGAARQIADKGDGSFRVAATLSVLPGDVGYQAARDILRGPEAAKTNPTVFVRQQAQAEFSTYAATALRGLPPDYSADVMSAARDLYTARMTAAGRTQWDGQAWRDAIDGAMGAYRKDGRKYGGVADFRGAAVSIPPGWTGDGVFRRLARATGTELSAASAGAAPVWPDGSAVYSGQLRDLVPVRVGGTRYGFMTRNARMLSAKGGGVYVLDVSKVPWR